MANMNASYTSSVNQSAYSTGTENHSFFVSLKEQLTSQTMRAVSDFNSFLKLEIITIKLFQ